MADFRRFSPKFAEIKKSGSAMTSAISQLVYMPNFRAIGQSVWEKNGNIQTHRNTHRNTDTLEFYIYRLAESTRIHGYIEKSKERIPKNAK